MKAVYCSSFAEAHFFNFSCGSEASEVSGPPVRKVGEGRCLVTVLSVGLWPNGRPFLQCLSHDLAGEGQVQAECHSIIITIANIYCVLKCTLPQGAL